MEGSPEELVAGGGVPLRADRTAAGPDAESTGESAAVAPDGRPNPRIDALLVGLFLLVTTAVGIWARGRWLNSFGDPGFAWSAVHRLALGEAPYRDLFLGYTPFSIEVLAFVSRLFGESARFWMLANWIPAVLVGSLLLVAARRHLDPLERIAVAVVFMALSLFVPGDGRLVYPYYPGVSHAALLALGALLFLHEGKWPIGRRAFCAGILAGLAFGCKQEIGVAAFAGLAAPLVTDPKRAIRWGAAAAGGAVMAVCIPFLLAMPLPSLASLASDSHLWPLALKAPPDLNKLFRGAAGIQESGWAFAVASSAVHLMLQCALILLVAMLVARPRAWKAWIPIGAVLAVVGLAWILEGDGPAIPRSPVCLSVLVSVAVAVIAFFRHSLPGRTFLIGFGSFAALAGVRTIFSPLTTLAYNGPARIAASLTWVVFLCVLLPELLVPAGRARRIARRLMAAAILAATIPSAIDGMKSLRFDDRRAVVTRQGTVFVTRAQEQILGVLSRNLVAGERAVLIPEANAVDVLYGVRDISPFIDLMPGWVDVETERRLIARFDRDPPSVVVLFDRPLQEYGVRPFGEGYGRELARWCERRFEVTDQRPGVKILRPRKTVGEARTGRGPEAGTRPESFRRAVILSAS